MNIKQAKDQIRNAVKAYRTKNIYGRPMIPLHKQRPLFLVGAPGIGKTAIVEQVAQELGLALVSYSITHHTRQSALGLPFIAEREYNGKTFRVSEYTMSEIIASVYKKMEETGLKEGILFLDEINCVSETLSPAMLQFLQYKVFGQHQVPKGWIIVTAGNPPEYNQSVREFDMVTEDRLKRIDIEPDYEVWKNWAMNEDIHPCVLSYLDVRKDEFYMVENTIDGRCFVTPRGWVDLSSMIKLYEINDIEVDELLVRQYLQNDKVARQFTVFYELWKKYQSDYHIQDILDGKESQDVVDRAKKAGFDERISLIGLLLDAQKNDMREVMNQRKLLGSVKKILNDAHESKQPIDDFLYKMIQQQEEKLIPEKRELLSEKEELEIWALVTYLKKAVYRLNQSLTEKENFDLLKKEYVSQCESLNQKAKQTSQRLENLFAFCEKAFDSSEMLIVVAELTSTNVSARYIGQYGSEAYFRHNKELLFYERSKEVLVEIDELL